MSSDLDDNEDDSGFGSTRARRGRGRGRGGRSSGLVMRGGRGNGFDDEAGFRSPRGQRGRGGRGSGVVRRGGRYSDLDDGDDAAGFGPSKGRHGRGGRMSGMSQRRGRESDLDDDNDDDDEVGFGDSGAREVKKFDFGLSKDDDEVGEVDEDDDPSGLEDDLIDDEGSKESGFFKLDKEEAVKHKSIAGTSTRGGDSYLSQKR